MVTAAVDLSQLQGDYPLANTEATKMLSQALEKANEDKGWSQRQVAKMLGYRSSVALSHMSIGRVPIPIDRALDFSRMLGMDPAEFLIAVIEQRHPDIDVRRVLSKLSKNTGKTAKAPTSIVALELEEIARRELDELPVETINVLREVVSDSNPQRRWLNLSEVSVIDKLRKSFPRGMLPTDIQKVVQAIDNI